MRSSSQGKILPPIEWEVFSFLEGVEVTEVVDPEILRLFHPAAEFFHDAAAHPTLEHRKCK